MRDASGCSPGGPGGRGGTPQRELPDDVTGTERFLLALDRLPSSRCRLRLPAPVRSRGEEYEVAQVFVGAGLWQKSSIGHG